MKANIISPFQTTFAVHMTCESCVQSITEALTRIHGLEKVHCDLESQLVTVDGSVAPSRIVSAIKSTGRDPILRGSGAPNSAAVCILETDCPNVADPIRGLARIVQVSPQVLVVDLTVLGLSPGTYAATIRECGDISKGVESTGEVWESSSSPSPRGFLSTLEVDGSGAGAVFLDKNISVWEVIGRSIVVSREHGTTTTTTTTTTTGSTEQKSEESNTVDTVLGVIARSAGVWENAKTVCSCSGKTMWDERKDILQRGMI